MEFLLKNDFSSQNGQDILIDFFSEDYSKSITLLDNKIYVDTVLIYVMDKEFYFYEFFDKSENEINNKIQFFSLCKNTDNEFDIYHRYEYGYEKYQILKQLLNNSVCYKITMVDNDSPPIIYEDCIETINEIFIF